MSALSGLIMLNILCTTHLPNTCSTPVVSMHFQLELKKNSVDPDQIMLLQCFQTRINPGPAGQGLINIDSSCGS